MCHFLQAAALALCQYLVAENRKPPGQTDKDEAPETVQVMTPTDSMAARAPRVRRIKPAEIPPTPLVSQLIEMGFVRKNVEFAIKALSKCIIKLGYPRSNHATSIRNLKLKLA